MVTFEKDGIECQADRHTSGTSLFPHAHYTAGVRKILQSNFGGSPSMSFILLESMGNLVAREGNLFQRNINLRPGGSCQILEVGLAAKAESIALIGHGF